MKHFKMVVATTAMLALEWTNAYESMQEPKPDNITYGGMLTCMGCNAGLNGLDSVLNNTTIKDAIFKFSIDICKLTGNGNELCTDIINNVMGPAVYDSFGRFVLTKDRICDEWLGVCNKPVIQEIDLHTVVDGILKDKPAVNKDDDFIDNLYTEIMKAEPR